MGLIKKWKGSESAPSRPPRSKKRVPILAALPSHAIGRLLLASAIFMSWNDIPCCGSRWAWSFREFADDRLKLVGKLSKLMMRLLSPFAFPRQILWSVYKLKSRVLSQQMKCRPSFASSSSVIINFPPFSTHRLETVFKSPAGKKVKLRGRGGIH